MMYFKYEAGGDFRGHPELPKRQASGSDRRLSLKQPRRQKRQNWTWSDVGPSWEDKLFWKRRWRGEKQRPAGKGGPHPGWADSAHQQPAGIGLRQLGRAVRTGPWGRHSPLGSPGIRADSPAWDTHSYSIRFEWLEVDASGSQMYVLFLLAIHWIAINSE